MNRHIIIDTGFDEFWTVRLQNDIHNLYSTPDLLPICKSTTTATVIATVNVTYTLISCCGLFFLLSKAALEPADKANAVSKNGSIELQR